MMFRQYFLHPRSSEHLSGFSSRCIIHAAYLSMQLLSSVSLSSREWKSEERSILLVLRSTLGHRNLDVPQ
jgi:hypothetical protein